ncbi:MAG TPA: GNAT family N-acetyltransferase [Steroidobacteraceae bacterium]|jgi:putative acetyltransferase|nr:GNAT family N-acetyltransferase [Steroidobacteraceae bacterium]
MLNPRIRRLARHDDLAAVHRIYMDDEVVPFLGIDPMPLDDFRPVFEGLLATKAFFVAARDDEVRGFYRVNRQKGRSQHVAVLETLAISPSEKGTGFAQAMIAEALECMRQEGIRRVELMVEADNPRALAFYRKLEFEQEGRLRAAYKRANQPDYVDELLMARLI